MKYVINNKINYNNREIFFIFFSLNLNLRRSYITNLNSPCSIAIIIIVNRS